MRKPGFPPTLVLFLLAPAIGELLSGSAPPAEFFTPFGFLMILCLYGSGALTFFLIFAPLQELDKTRTDDTQGMTLVAIATIIALIMLRRRIEQQNQPKSDNATRPNSQQQTT